MSTDDRTQPLSTPPPSPEGSSGAAGPPQAPAAPHQAPHLVQDGPTVETAAMPSGGPGYVNSSATAQPPTRRRLGVGAAVGGVAAAGALFVGGFLVGSATADGPSTSAAAEATGAGEAAAPDGTAPEGTAADGTAPDGALPDAGGRGGAMPGGGGLTSGEITGIADGILTVTLTDGTEITVTTTDSTTVTTTETADVSALAVGDTVTVTGENSDDSSDDTSVVATSIAEGETAGLGRPGAGMGGGGPQGAVEPNATGAGTGN